MNGFDLSALLAPALLLGALWLMLRVLRRDGGWFTTVHEWEHGLLYHHGRFVRVLTPGRHFTPPYGGDVVSAVRRTDTVLQLFPSDVTSQDKLAFRLSGNLIYAVVEPKLAYENPHVEQLRLAANEALIRLAAERDLDQLLSERAALGEAFHALLPEAVCGCRISRAAVTGIVLPPELRRLFSEVERARREGEAALERARGETAALRSLANAARMLKGNPELMNLRLLQALTPSGKGQPTLVLGAGSIQPIRLGEPPGQEDEGSAGL